MVPFYQFFTFPHKGTIKLLKTWNPLIDLLKESNISSLFQYSKNLMGIINQSISDFIDSSGSCQCYLVLQLTLEIFRHPLYSFYILGERVLQSFFHWQNRNIINKPRHQTKRGCNPSIQDAQRVPKVNNKKNKNKIKKGIKCTLTPQKRINKF